jgi:hypothetical protein
VYHDTSADVLYVSCINGVPADKKDEDGFIAKVGMDGKIINLKWATGLSAPKGMGKLVTIFMLLISTGWLSSM